MYDQGNVLIVANDFTYILKPLLCTMKKSLLSFHIARESMIHGTHSC